MKYLWSIVAALVLTAVALYLYGQPLGTTSWFHYAAVAVVAVVATAVFERYLKVWWVWLVAALVITLGLVVFPPWPVYLGVGVLAAALAATLTSSSAPKKASAGH